MKSFALFATFLPFQWIAWVWHRGMRGGSQRACSDPGAWTAPCGHTACSRRCADTLGDAGRRCSARVNCRRPGAHARCPSNGCSERSSRSRMRGCSTQLRIDREEKSPRLRP